MKGAKKHIDRLKKLSGPQVTRLAGQVVFEGADLIRAEAFHLVGTGSGSFGRHVPSAPGEPPNRDIGTLQDNMRVYQTGPVSAEFRSEAEYAGALEFGTSKMAARPYVRPARDAKVKEIRKRMVDQMNKLVARSG